MLNVPFLGYLGKSFRTDTLFVLLEKLADVMPQAAHIRHEGLNLTVINYNLWKEKMRRYQQKEHKNE